MVVLGAALLSIAVFAGIFAWMMTGAKTSPEARLNAGLRLLKKGQTQEAKLRAASIDEASLKDPAEQSKHHLVFGAAALDDAEHARLRQTEIAKAKESEEHLQKSKKIGFPRGYEGLGNFLLGKVLVMLFRGSEAMEPLDAAIAEWPSGRVDSLERLIDIELAEEKPDFELLRERLHQWDALAGLTKDERELAGIKRIEVELAAGQSDAAEQVAKSVPDDSRYAVNAKYLMALTELKHQQSLATQNKPEFESILKVMQDVSRELIVDNRTRRRSKYYSGLIYLTIEQPIAAMTTFSALRQEFPQTVESTAATIEEIQALIALNRYEDASRTLKLLTDQFGDLSWYQNHWMPLKAMRDRTNELGQELVKAKAYPELISFAEHLPPFNERVDKLKLLAVGYQRWALSLKEKALGIDPLLDIRNAKRTRESDASTDERQQQLFSKAAQFFKELAIHELRSPEYSDLIWSAIDSSQAAGELTQSNAMIANNMAYEPRDRQPRSILKIAENHFAMQELESALIQLQRCINQHPEHPLSYQARLNAARILSEQSQFDQAIDYLDKNLYASQLTPESPVWRESFFELGKIHFQRGEKQHAEGDALQYETTSLQKNKRIEKLEASNTQFIKSIACLEEWIKRYPEDSRRFETMYAIGQAYQMAAQWNTVQINEKLLNSDEQIRSRVQEKRKLLDSARKTFKEIRDGMNSSKDLAVLDVAQQRLLRNSYFAEADLMFQSKDYEGALATYRNIANRLANEPEAMEALSQAADCLKRLGREEESRRVIAQARHVLEQIPAQRDQQFVSFTRFSRNEWSKHLDWMGKDSL